MSNRLTKLDSHTPSPVDFWLPENASDLFVALATIFAAFTAWKVFSEAKKIRRATWLSNQNQAWTAYNQGAATDLVECNMAVNDLCDGKIDDRFILADDIGDFETRKFLYRVRVLFYARFNILESDYFGYIRGYTDVSTLYYLIGEAKSISKNFLSVIYVINFLCKKETYDPKFASFYSLLIISYYRLHFGDNERYILAADHRLNRRIISSASRKCSSQGNLIRQKINILLKELHSYPNSEQFSEELAKLQIKIVSAGRPFTIRDLSNDIMKIKFDELLNSLGPFFTMMFEIRNSRGG